MKTKVILTINGVANELNPDCLYNWDEVICAYKRTEFSGIVRSFSSQFEFVNDAYEMLLSEYIKAGVRAEASVAILTLNNDWSWSKQFEAALNFATATWDGYIFTINCLDDSLAALISARKSTKYEFEIGNDIEAGGILNYDRITMQNSCAHEIMGDENASNGAVLIPNANSSTRLPVYSLRSETFENSPILFQDQTTDAGSAFITAVRSVSNMKIRVEIWSNSTGYNLGGSTESVEIHLKKFTGTDNELTDLGIVYAYNGVAVTDRWGTTWQMPPRTCVGIYKNLEALKRAYPNPNPNVYAIISPTGEIGDVESVYYTPFSNNTTLIQWEQGNAIPYRAHRGSLITAVYCYNIKYIMEFDIANISNGQKFALFYTAKSHIKNNVFNETPYFPLFSKITTHWVSRAKALEITAIKPITLMKRLVERMSDDKYNIIPQFSDFDPRLDKTYLLAAESVRAIAGAKIYSSFNDFKDWMETVFGYVYTLGEPIPPQYKGMREITGIEDDWSFDVGDVHGVVVNGYCPDGFYGEDPFFVRSHNCFCVWDNHETGNMYTQWKDSHKYNDENGVGRKDLIFDDGRNYYIIGEDNDIVQFSGDAKAASRITQSIRFLHRSELFQNQDQDIVFRDAVELQSKVNNSMIYSVVEVGYEMQDYETECGRDEWNFMNYYNTGIDVIEKKLTLQSKYRADCYGLEFLSQERAKDSTDNKSDKTIFFVHCIMKKTEEVQDSDDSESRAEGDEAVNETITLEIDRSANIQGALTDTVFNGEFSPCYCVKANEGYISAMAPDVTLQFASSDGNSDIVINGVKTTADIKLPQRLFSEVELQFTDMELDQDIDFSKLIKVVKRGLVYSGYMKQVNCYYARPSEVEYTLIVKSIEQL